MAISNAPSEWPDDWKCEECGVWTAAVYKGICYACRKTKLWPLKVSIARKAALNAIAWRNK